MLCGCWDFVSDLQMGHKAAEAIMTGIMSLVPTDLFTARLSLLTTFPHVPNPQPSASGNYQSDLFLGVVVVVVVEIPHVSKTMQCSLSPSGLCH